MSVVLRAGPRSAWRTWRSLERAVGVRWACGGSTLLNYRGKHRKGGGFMSADHLVETIKEQLANGRHRHQIITGLVAAGFDRDEVSRRVLEIEQAKRLVLRNRERRQAGFRKLVYGAGAAVLGCGVLLGVKVWLGTVGPYTLSLAPYLPLPHPSWGKAITSSALAVHRPATIDSIESGWNYVGVTTPGERPCVRGDLRAIPTLPGGKGAARGFPGQRRLTW